MLNWFNLSVYILSSLSYVRLGCRGLENKGVSYISIFYTNTIL